MSKALGIINFAGNHINVRGLQFYRPVGAISFLGRYRVIDFPISNFSNSGIENIHVYVRRKPRSLAEHLGTGRHYNINSKRGRLHLLFAEEGMESLYSNDISAYIDNIEVIESASSEYVIIAPSCMVFKQDFNALLNQHIESGADITLLCLFSSKVKGRCRYFSEPGQQEEPLHFYGYLCNEERFVYQLD